MGNQRKGSMPPVKIQGKTGATPAGWLSMEISVSRKPGLPQLKSSCETSLGTQVYQNSSLDWLCAKTSRYAFSMLVGMVNVPESVLAVLLRETVPPVGPAESGSTALAVTGAVCPWASGKNSRLALAKMMPVK